MPEPALTVYHDGSCPLCRLEIGQYKGARGADRIDFVVVSQPGTDPGPDLWRSEAMGRFHVRLPSGELRSGAAAFVEIWGCSRDGGRQPEQRRLRARCRRWSSATGPSRRCGRRWRRSLGASPTSRSPMGKPAVILRQLSLVAPIRAALIVLTGFVVVAAPASVWAVGVIARWIQKWH